MTLVHGGQLAKIAQRYEIDEKHWLDLSTGIAPFSYPIPEIPAHYWQALPTIPSSLISQANNYYQSEHCWPISGSQSLIERLPQLWKQAQCQLEKQSESEQSQTVYLPKIGYKEHQKAWQDAGFICEFYQQDLPTKLVDFAVVVVINPNNPTTEYFEQSQLSTLASTVKKANGLLVIDEAFADMLEPEQSFTAQLTDDNHQDVIILRSFGKFFGLAGLRIGFICSSHHWIEIVKSTFGPWQINGLALYIAEQAFGDKLWQLEQKQRLVSQSAQLKQLLAHYFTGNKLSDCPLFITLHHPQAPKLFHLLCQQGVYVRLCDEQNALRFGIPNDEQFIRLNAIFSTLFE